MSEFFDFSTPITGTTKLKAKWCYPPSELMQLKMSLERNGMEATKLRYPIGYEFDDEIFGKSNPLVVVHYVGSRPGGNSYPACSYELEGQRGIKCGVILMRKYAQPAAITWETRPNYYPQGSTQMAMTFLSSELCQWLQTEYYDACSDQVKEVLEQTIFVSSGGLTATYSPRYWWIPSAHEVCGTDRYQQGLNDRTLNVGDMFEYFVERTGYTEPNANATPGRMFDDVDGNNVMHIFTRSLWKDIQPYTIFSFNGAMSYTTITPTQQAAILPTMMIAIPQ